MQYSSPENASGVGKEPIRQAAHTDTHIGAQGAKRRARDLFTNGQEALTDLKDETARGVDRRDPARVNALAAVLTSSGRNVSRIKGAVLASVLPSAIDEDAPEDSILPNGFECFLCLLQWVRGANYRANLSIAYQF